MKLPRRAVLGNHDHIPSRWNPRVLPKPLAQQPLDPISNDRASHFLGDRQPKPTAKLRGAASFRDTQDMAAMHLHAPVLHREVIGALPQPHVLGDARRRATMHRSVYFFATVTEIRLRPLARRRRRTVRPPRVFLRARNPWVRLRLLLCGW